MNEAELCSSASFDVKSLEQENIVVERHKILYVVVRHKKVLGYRLPWRYSSCSLDFFNLSETLLSHTFGPLLFKQGAQRISLRPRRRAATIPMA